MNFLTSSGSVSLRATIVVAALTGCASSVGPGGAREAGTDAGSSTRTDTGSSTDAGVDARTDAGRTRRDAGVDASIEPGACRVDMVDALRAPSVVFAGDPLPIAVTAATAGCGCEPDLALGFPVGEPVFSVCNCCDLCDCVDPGYVGNMDVTSSTAPGPFTLAVNGQSREYTVIPAGTVCTPSASVEDVRVVTDDGLRPTGPRRVWAEVTGFAQRCSSDPLAHIEVGREEPIFLTASDCNLTDCDGPTGPRPFTVWVSLGELAPGEHLVFFGGGMTRSFTVR